MIIFLAFGGVAGGAFVLRSYLTRLVKSLPDCNEDFEFF
jgi:hypothetical protein